ncbi:MAG: 50S ribosomal protein L15 [Candidatus Altiarchaeota archaeon]|nr:50S ribosomal protein L15 [Candidatus Altiarchaeota archaeon]
MAHNARKIRKLRGSRTCGYGNTQKHRGAGSHGGRGMAGSKKHKWSYVSKYMPNYFGYTGFKRPPAVVKKLKTINVGCIEQNLELLVSEKKAEIKNKKYSIDLRAMGYDKLLGSGKITHPVDVVVDSCSKLAATKIEDAGGKVEMPE